jgi:hypothetical protein
MKNSQYRQRVENILLSLKRCDYLSRSQIQQMHNLKSTRNANRVLKSMDEYLYSYRNGLEKVYYLNQRGRDQVNCKVIRKKTQNVSHTILRNQLFIHLGYPSTWKNEIKVKVGGVSLICDAKFEHKKTPCFVEVDCAQSMKRNRAKIEKYRKFRELAGSFQLIWITDLESRRSRLEELCSGLNHRIYTSKEVY